MPKAKETVEINFLFLMTTLIIFIIMGCNFSSSLVKDGTIQANHQFWYYYFGVIGATIITNSIFILIKWITLKQKERQQESSKD